MSEDKERWNFTDRFRIAVERDDKRSRFRRYRWSVEESQYGGGSWRWLASGYSPFPRRAYKLAHRRVAWNRWPWTGTHRIEAVVVRQHSCRAIPDRPAWAVEPVDLEVLR